MNEDIKLTDLFEVEVLQRIQDAFSKMTGIASIITDANGTPVTKGSNFTDFCAKYTRSSALGCIRCEQCDKHGAEIALKVGASVTYFCHAGLIDFAAPIMAGDKMIGCFVGGQVLTDPPDITKLMQVASEIDVELINYLQAALKINVMPKEKVENAAYFLYTLTDVLSSIAYHKYEMNQANIAIEKMANLKSDFLANMSHEIRTPMNGVIGMAELALREELNPVAEEYISQIKASGKTLLTIINDILDFSKIESGKLSIIPAHYNPTELVNDTVNIITTRVNNNVEFLIDFNPDIPKTLLGDNIRINQIMNNICNNAAKFTPSGFIKLTVDYKKKSSKSIDLIISIEDTGIGIKKDDLEKLFESFSQLDSKRNRNIEGTGLGLAISKQLATLMDGDITVDSVYEKGSIFTLHVPQKIIDKEPCVILKNENDIKCLGLITDERVETSLVACLDRLDVAYCPFTSLSTLKKKSKEDVSYIFFEESTFSPEYQQFIRENSDLTAVCFTHYDSNVTYPMSNVIICKKPFSTISLASIFNDKEYVNNNGEDNNQYDFIAPTAEVLIVDDNKINLTVAEGLILPTQIKIDKANSGKEAIDKISAKKYDLIFMDHMMPELDGVETTHLIRRFHKNYDEVPIIALTANAVAGIKDMFLSEGFNDFLAKPIELSKLLVILKNWLPADKMIKDDNIKPRSVSRKTNIVIEGLDTQAALTLLGSEELFWSVLKDYYMAIPKKIASIKEFEEEEKLRDYTIEVHALKSASKQIGATDISMLALELENAGNENNIKLIHEKTDELLSMYFKYYGILSSLFPDVNMISEDADVTPLSDETIISIFDALAVAMDDLDMDAMSDACAGFDEYNLDGDEGELLRKLLEAVSNIDVDSCEEIIAEWKTVRGI